MPALLFGVGRDQRVRSANGRFAEWLGVEGNAAGRSFKELFGDAAATRERLRARMLGSTASTAWMAPHRCVSRQVR